MSEDIFDFGFTAVNEEELEAVQQATQTIQATSAEASSSQEKLDKLYNAVQPLLNNLKQNPEKEYIYWPNRLSKVEQFEDYIQQIYSKQ
jgi:flagellar capping protein FliD